MNKKILVRLTAGDKKIEGFHEIRAELIKLRGFPQYEFVIHRPLKWKLLCKDKESPELALERTGWMISEVSTGTRVLRFPCGTQEVAKRQAIRRLKEHALILAEKISERLQQVHEAQRKLSRRRKRQGGEGGSNL